MANPGLVARLKLNLSLTTKAYDDYLGQLLDAASGMIAREGINLNTTARRTHKYSSCTLRIYSANARRIIP